MEESPALPVRMEYTVWDWKTPMPFLCDGETSTFCCKHPPAQVKAISGPPSYSQYTPRVCSAVAGGGTCHGGLLKERLHYPWSPGFRRPQRDDWQPKLRHNTTVNQ